jgi:catalase
MTDNQRHNLHSNTAELLRRVDFKAIKVGYLAQLWNIDPDYAKAVYDMLAEAATSGTEGFEFVDVQDKAKGAELAGKEAKFRLSMSQERLTGFAPEMGVYNL